MRSDQGNSQQHSRESRAHDWTLESGFVQLGRILAEIASSSQECNTQDEGAPPHLANMQNNCTAIQPLPPGDCYTQGEDDQS